MKIAIQAADLDHDRIDGTRVYLSNLLRHFGNLNQSDEFFIYHKKKFNPELAPPTFPNYFIKKVRSPILWTQTRFALELLRDKPDVLWMPMQNIPLVRKKSAKTVVTIHDLAFKYFPEHFPAKDYRRLNFLTKSAIKRADKLIAVSESTKKDILKFYPKVREEDVKVIYHGFNKNLFEKIITSQKTEEVLKSYNLNPKNYLLYVGAIQPRKNLETLIEAFNEVKKGFPELKLVIAGDKAWLWEDTFKKIEGSPKKDDIIVTGKVSFEDLPILYRNSSLFVFPSLYEGFGIPILEAFVSGVPVITPNNSSLPEVGGDAALYFDENNINDLVQKIKKVLVDKNLQIKMIQKGREQLKNFSWEKCARETLDWLKN